MSDFIDPIYIIAKIFIPFVFLSLLLPYVKKFIKSPVKYAKTEKTSGIVFGRRFGFCAYSPSKSEGHVLTLAPTGGGKTSAILIPTLRSWGMEEFNSSLTIDISGDINTNTKMMPRKLIFDPTDPNTIPYNVFGFADSLEGDTDGQNEALAQLALLIMPDNISSKSEAGDYFNQMGRTILTAALVAFYHDGYDFNEICEMVLSSSYITLFNAIDKTDNALAKMYINGFDGVSERNISGCMQAAHTALQLFATNTSVKRCLRRPYKGERSLSPEEIETHNVFIVIPDHLLKLYAPLVSIIVSQSLEHFSRRPLNAKTSILFCLNEFASFNLDISEALQKLRKRKVRLLVLTQSLADLERLYDVSTTSSMVGNFSFLCVLGANDVRTQEQVSKLLGYQKIKNETITRGQSGEVSVSETQSRELVIEPSELAYLGDRLILKHPQGHVRLKKNYYFKRWLF